MPIIGTELNVLRIPRNIFLHIPAQRKVMLRLYLNANDQFTLAAWVGNVTDYDPTVLHTLIIDQLSGYRIKPNCMLGDQKIDSTTIAAVQAELTNNTTYKVFLQPTDDTTYPNQLAFDILVGNTLSFALTTTSFGLTKPSPPYNSKV